MEPVRIEYFSDLLCVWAYVGERRVTELVRAFGEDIAIESHFCSVFPDARGKIETGWKTRGGYAGFNRHLLEVAAKFPHVTVHEKVWLEARPRTSASPHMFVKALEVIEQDAQAGPYLERPSTRAATALRSAFFAKARDISDWREQRAVAAELAIDYDAIRARIDNSEAVAALAADINLAHHLGVTGSPTFLMNEGRQRLFGNVGFRLLEANVQELLRDDADSGASWC